LAKELADEVAAGKRRTSQIVSKEQENLGALAGEAGLAHLR
jgi:hypothetical protein